MAHPHPPDDDDDRHAEDEFNASERRRFRRARRRGRRLAKRWVKLFLRINAASDYEREAFDQALDGLGDWIAGDTAAPAARRALGGDGNLSAN